MDTSFKFGKTIKIVLSVCIAWQLFAVEAFAHKVLSIEERQVVLKQLNQQNKPVGGLVKHKAFDPIYRDLFKNTDILFPTPDHHRTGDGRSGPEYVENRADYKLHVSIDEKNAKLSGKVVITYINNSPNDLPYLWLQLDQQRENANQAFISEGIMKNGLPVRRNDPNGKAVLGVQSLKEMLDNRKYGFIISSVTSNNEKLDHFIQGTMMRVELPIAAKSKATLTIHYSFVVPNLESAHLARMGYEEFKNGDRTFQMMQFYPRMAYYDAIDGWDITPYLDFGEFNLHFGNFEAFITVPDNHIVASTGELQNTDEVLNKTQRDRLTKVKNSKSALYIVDIDEADDNIKTKSHKTKEWHFKADNVRDFAFSSSKRFIWKSKSILSGEEEKRPVLLNSFYVKEGSIFGSKFSIPAAELAIKTYSKFTYDYPYPVLNLVEGEKMSMEYPMLATYHFRQQSDNTYSLSAKAVALQTIIHEAGHNYAPMTLSPNERKWAWMDEGFTTFMQSETTTAWSDGSAVATFGMRDVVMKFMKRKNRSNMMNWADNYTQLEYIVLSYPMAAAGLKVLRETILGRELFDKAFKEFFKTWKFKHPTPYDFFRHMNIATGRDLTWFWRGWFYSPGHVDIGISRVALYRINTLNASVEKNIEQKNRRFNYDRYIATSRDKSTPKVVEVEKSLKDLYDGVFQEKTPLDEVRAQQEKKALGKKWLKYLNVENYFLQVELTNFGGIVMPIILRLNFQDGSEQIVRYSANIWRKNKSTVTDVVIMLEKGKKISSVTLDPYLETYDVSRMNNNWAYSEDEQIVHTIKLTSDNETHNVPNMQQLLRSLKEKKKEKE